MPAKKSVPSYLYHKPSGQARVRINGRDIWLGKYDSPESHEKYSRIVAELAARPSTGKRAPAPPPTGDALSIAELLLAYWNHAQSYYRKDGKPTSEVASLRWALRPVRELYGNTPAAAFGPLALKAVRQKFIESGMARGTVNQNIGRIRAMFKWAASEEMLPASVYQSLQTVSGLRKGRSAARETEPVLPVDDATVDATLSHLTPIVADMVRLQRLTGARPSEVCDLRPCDIDRGDKVWQYVPASHKTEHHGRQRVILVGPKAQAILRPYLLRESTAHCFSPQESEAQRRESQHAQRKTPAKYGNRPGTNRKRKPKRAAGAKYDQNSYRRAVHRACDVAFPAPEPLAKRDDEPHKAHLGRLTELQRADLRQWQAEHRWSPNQLRHSAATEIRRRFGLERAGAVLGHSNLSVTEVYAERDMQAAAEVMAEVG